MMPVIFVGHGSPMNAIEENSFSKGWREMAKNISRPKAILAVSAHWYTEGTRVQTALKPRTIHDFYGFPKELYEIGYPASGEPELARRVLELVPGSFADDTWGIDHGTWSVLKWMYPDADIPVVQLSVSRSLSPQQALDTGALLKPLRDEGVLILGSGNVVHNLGMVDFSAPGGYDWAGQFDGYISGAIQAGEFEKAVAYGKAGESARLSVPTRDHFDPLLYSLGAANGSDRVSVWNQSCTLGSLSMTSYLFS